MLMFVRYTSRQQTNINMCQCLRSDRISAWKLRERVEHHGIHLLEKGERLLASIACTHILLQKGQCSSINLFNACLRNIEEGERVVGSPNGSLHSNGSFNGKLTYTHTQEETLSLLWKHEN